MVYAQLAAVWLICSGVAVMIGWRATRFAKQQRRPGIEILNPVCGQCWQELDLTPGAMPHVCPPVTATPHQEPR